MTFPAATRILFEIGDDAAAGGGTIRDQLLHTSYQIDFDSRYPYKKLTIPISSDLDKPVEVMLYGRSETPGDTWHKLGPTVNITATGGAKPDDYITLTDLWKSIKITVQETSGANPTAGQFLAKLIPLLED